MASEERFPRIPMCRAIPFVTQQGQVRVDATLGLDMEERGRSYAPVVILDARDYADLRRAADVLARLRTMAHGGDPATPLDNVAYVAVMGAREHGNVPDVLAAALAAADAATEER